VRVHLSEGRIITRITQFGRAAESTMITRGVQKSIARERYGAEGAALGVRSIKELLGHQRKQVFDFTTVQNSHFLPQSVWYSKTVRLGYRLQKPLECSLYLCRVPTANRFETPGIASSRSMIVLRNPAGISQNRARVGCVERLSVARVSPR